MQEKTRDLSVVFPTMSRKSHFPLIYNVGFEIFILKTDTDLGYFKVQCSSMHVLVQFQTEFAVINQL